MGRKLHKMDAFKLHFYRQYLLLFEYSKPEDIKDYDEMLYERELPSAVRKIAYKMKHKAKYCTDRNRELDLLDALSLVLGSQPREKASDKIARIGRRDPLKKACILEDLGVANINRKGLM